MKSGKEKIVMKQYPIAFTLMNPVNLEGGVILNQAVNAFHQGKEIIVTH